MCVCMYVGVYLPYRPPKREKMATNRCIHIKESGKNLRCETFSIEM